MYLTSEMEKNSTEDDCVDSGAETGGSDSSPMYSESSELSMGDLQDPFLVSVHIITDPGYGKPLQEAVDGVLSWIHPELQLFRVSERGAWQQRPKRARPNSASSSSSSFSSSSSSLGLPSQPALAVILFLQEDYSGEEQILRLHRTLQRPPWRYHHTERVNGRLLPLVPCSQDFFTLAPGTPLWAVRQVHYGKEIIRFTVYCRHDSFADMVSMYRLVLQRRLAQRKEDFCFFVVFSSPDTEIQLSFKRLPRGQSAAPMESAIMEFRVRDVGALVPLLPRPCTPISEVRWQTEDYDGNKILLQVLGTSRYRRRHTIAQFTSLPADPSLVYFPPPPEPTSAPPYGRGPASYRNRRYHRTSSRSRNQSQGSQQDLSQACKESGSSRRRDPEASRASWTGHRTRSLFTLPTADTCSSAPCSAPCSAPASPAPLHLHRSSMTRPFRLNVDTLVGAEETDVDTGQKLDSGAVDVSVVSAYAKPRRTLSASLHDPFPSFSRLSCRSLGPPAPRRSGCSASPTPCTLRRPRPHSACLPLGGTEPENTEPRDEPTEEEEFYI